MPGLSQLKKFSSDLLSLGDEVVVRAGRGEKPVEVPIPKDVQDVDDSDDFVIGMPEGEELVEDNPVDEDLSDLAGITSSDNANGNDGADEGTGASFDVPDMSGLLDPIGGGDFGSDDMPDLSMFADEPAAVEEPEPEEIVEEEPEEVSVADMGLDDLLSGGGFDEPEDNNDFDELDSLNDENDLSGDSGVSAGTGDDGAFGLDDFGELEDVDDVQPLDEPFDDTASGNDFDNIPSSGDNGISDFDNVANDENQASDGSDLLKELGDFGDIDELGGLDDLGEASDNINDEGVSENPPLDDFFYEPFGDGDNNVEDAEVVSEEEPANSENPVAENNDNVLTEDNPLAEDSPFDMDDLSSGSENTGDDSSFDLGELGDLDDLGDLGELGSDSEGNEESFDDIPEAENAADNDTVPEDIIPEDIDSEEVPQNVFSGDDNIAEPENNDSDNFDLPDFDNIGDSFDSGTSDGENAGFGSDGNSSDDFGDTVNELDDFDSDFGDDSNGSADSGFEEPLTSEDSGNDDFTVPDFNVGDEPDSVNNENADDNVADIPVDDLPEDFDEPLEEVSPEERDARFADSGDVDLDSPFDSFSTDGLDELPEIPGESDGSDDFSGNEVPAGGDFGGGNITANDDIPDYGDFDIDEGNDSGNEEPLEVFDTSEMEGLDFDIPDTDTQLENVENADDGFEFGDEFEIPGFSDVETVGESSSKDAAVHDTKKKKGKHGAVPAAAEPEEDDVDKEKEDLPPNTLSDKQYKTFLKNLNEYPLNVRLAFEELMVKDEFTDDAEFEIIETILNKAPARQVAGRLEKMLDISIPVPRDYEHRSASEYEAYKKSLSYQLKNKIIPAALLGIVGILVCIGLFNFGKNCIYKPLKANSLYKQGYVLIEEREYPLSEIKFKEATEYRLNKKWFFKYARAYRDHKQYQRAGKMYKNILYCFNHDKEAGLEYADMELNDLANYERAEEIVRREVLDYHINDADGILKLGDIFLEWGTEKDPAKLEDARAQYATLLQMYGQEDLYLSRMMRYFIRSDNLREVLQLKQHFEPEEESLCADDWTELSGYLLDKYYGELSPAEEYLRYEIEGLRSLLLRAVESNPQNPVALYNLSRYFINTNETEYIESSLQDSLEKFNDAKVLKNRDIYKYIDAYRLLGEYYVDTDDFLKAQEQFAEGISLYITERDNAGFKGNKGVGKLYEDMGNLKYSISGNYDEALLNYNQSVELGNDSPAIRYRIGYVQYHNRNYDKALSAFMKAGDGNIKERNLLLAMANTLSIRGDDYAAEGYYNQLIETLDSDFAKRGLILPQANEKDYNIVNTYLCASNNYGVTLYRLAKKTGDSGKNADAIVQFSESVRAWDALTRNPETMVRLGGSNLAEQNIKYITHPISDFEPAIYTSIPKTLLDNEGI